MSVVLDALGAEQGVIDLLAHGSTARNEASLQSEQLALVSGSL